MKHIFIVNPCAGPKDATSEIQQQIAQLPSSYSTEIYTTRSAGDATRYVREQCQANLDQQLRFYACGGDGTISEVVSGIVGQPNAEMTCYPSGSGNDFVKYYGGRDTFLDLKRLVDGNVHEIDVMRIGDRYSLNICNFGFDAVVCRTMEQVRRKPIIGGRNAYTTGILKALFTGRRTLCRIAVDDVTVHDGPLSQNDDGLIEVCFFKPMSIFNFARLIGSYRDGSFINRSDVKDKMTYLRGKTIDIESPSAIDLCIDGEIVNGSRFRVELLPRAVRFITPRD